MKNMTVSVNLSKEEFGLIKKALGVVKVQLNSYLAANKRAVSALAIEYSELLELIDQLKDCDYCHAYSFSNGEMSKIPDKFLSKIVKSNAELIIYPADLRDYLLATGWSLCNRALEDRIYVFEDRIYLFENELYKGRQLVFPMDAAAPDYRESVLRVISKLEELTGARLDASLARINDLKLGLSNGGQEWVNIAYRTSEGNYVDFEYVTVGDAYGILIWEYDSKEQLIRKENLRYSKDNVLLREEIIDVLPCTRTVTGVDTATMGNTQDTEQ
jgi:hypothetical protein